MFIPRICVRKDISSLLPIYANVVIDNSIR